MVYIRLLNLLAQEPIRHKTMANFAQLENNKVVQVICVHNNELLDENGVESEEKGIVFCKNIFGENTVWKQTSYNNNIRKNFAGIGYTYDKIRDAFIPPKAYLSMIFDEQTCTWIFPVPYPTDNKVYEWDEITTSWIEITE
jgi:hypothetical protein